MIVHHRLHVGPQLVGRAVDEPFQIRLASAGLDRLAVEGELDEVLALDAIGRPRPRQEEAVGPVRVSHADMAERIDDLLARENPVRGDELVQQRVQFVHGGALKGR
jgi:hypothetical protein